MIFVVPGKPQGKERPRTVRINGFVHSYTPAKTAQYEKSVQEAYLLDAQRESWMEGEPLSVSIDVLFEIPKSYPKKKREEAIKGTLSPTKRPDLDNIAKAICDALNNIAYKDDAQIVELNTSKKYTEKKPCVVVTIENFSKDGIKSDYMPRV